MEKFRETLEETWHFYKKTLTLVVKGSTAYYAWCFLLLAFIITGLSYYLKQHDIGLFATNMNDQVSWGLYIANFTYLVGAAAAAVLVVIPAYIYHFKPIKEIVILAPPTPFGARNENILALCHELGITEVYQMGGAQAVAAEPRRPASRSPG